MLLSNKLHSYSWDLFLDEAHRKELIKIEKKLGDKYTPTKENVLRFMNNDLNKIKICIIGQDPYFSVQQDCLVANGRAFQPSNLNHWDQSFQQVSLKNIIRLIHKSYKDIENYEDIYKYKDIVDEIRQDTFSMKQPKEWFESLERQGVLFLNRYLTTEIGKANAHRHIWDSWVADLIRYIDQVRPDMIWFLWGKEAIQCNELLKGGIVYNSRHPMMCSNKYEDDFLKSNCFRETMDTVNWLG